jgi:hypothetical protein
MAADDLTDLESALRQLIDDLQRDGVPFAFVGGFAVSVRAEALHKNWQRWGQPSRDRFGLTVTTSGDHTLWLDHSTRSVAAM